MSRGDLFEVEGIKVSLELLKASAALSVAYVASLGTYLKSAGISLTPAQFLFAMGPCGLSCCCSLAALFIAVRSLVDGENPMERGVYWWLSLAAPSFFVVGLFLGVGVLF